MPTTKVTRGLEFELSQPSPEREGAPKVSGKEEEMVVTGAQFELSRPARVPDPSYVGSRSPKHSPRPSSENGAELSDAQKFFLARPGEGDKRPVNDRETRGGRGR